MLTLKYYICHSSLQVVNSAYQKRSLVSKSQMKIYYILARTACTVALRSYNQIYRSKGSKNTFSEGNSFFYFLRGKLNILMIKEEKQIDVRLEDFQVSLEFLFISLSILNTQYSVKNKSSKKKLKSYQQIYLNSVLLITGCFRQQRKISDKIFFL